MNRVKWAVFVDRDGTVIEEMGYLSDPDKVKLVNEAASAIAKLNKRAVQVVVISNQAGIARGLFTAEDLGRVNQRMLDLLRSHGASIDAVYYCPHHPDHDTECDCRKPKPGLLLRASRELGIELSRSFMVGDRLIDMEAGKAAGTSTVFLRTGYGEREMAENPGRIAETADSICSDLSEAIEWILSKKE